MSLAHLKIILANRKGEHEHQVGVRYDVLERAVQEFTALMDRVCTCTQVAQFDPPTVNTPLDADFQLKRLKRMRGEDEEFARRAGS